MEFNTCLRRKDFTIIPDIAKIIQSCFRVSHRLLIAGFEVRPHCAAEKINAIYGDTFVSQKIHIGKFCRQPVPELLFILPHRHARVIFMITGDKQNRLLPVLEKGCKRCKTFKSYDVASQDQDISLNI